MGIWPGRRHAQQAGERLTCPMCGTTELWFQVSAQRNPNQLPTVDGIIGLVICDKGHEFPYENLAWGTSRMWPWMSRQVAYSLEQARLWREDSARRYGHHWLAQRILARRQQAAEQWESVAVLHCSDYKLEYQQGSWGGGSWRVYARKGAELPTDLWSTIHEAGVR